MSIVTPVTQLLNIQHPVLLAGMGQTSGAPLAAAVCNAGNELHFDAAKRQYTDTSLYRRARCDWWSRVYS